MKGFIFINQHGQYAKITNRQHTGSLATKKFSYTSNLNEATVFDDAQAAVTMFPQLANDILMTLQCQQLPQELLL